MLALSFQLRGPKADIPHAQDDLAALVASALAAFGL
jgi:hypothetical protein